MQQQQTQMQQFEKSYPPPNPISGRNESPVGRNDFSGSPPPKSTKRPLSGVPVG